ncbi:MAG: aminopeptidase P family protein, partial [Sphingomonadales bacterium]
MMRASRREFLIGAGVAGLSTTLPIPAWAAGGAAGLTSMAKDAKPITAEERLARIAKAQRLMRAEGMSALLIEAGSSLLYFTGIDWWRSERLTAAIIPAEGELLIITPGFEEPSIRESLAVPGKVEVWQEDESPIALIRAFLARHKLDKGVIGIEETVRFFAVDGVRAALPGATIRSGASVVRGCRMIKSAAELALMQVAADIQIAAFRHVAGRIEKGMGESDLRAMLVAASKALGGDNADGGLILIGEASAYPHGSTIPHRVTEGGIILFDAGLS